MKTRIEQLSMQELKNLLQDSEQMCVLLKQVIAEKSQFSGGIKAHANTPIQIANDPMKNFIQQFVIGKRTR